MAVGDQDCRRVAVAIIFAGSILQTVHFLRGQIFPLPQIGVGRPTSLTDLRWLRGGERGADFPWQMPPLEGDFPYKVHLRKDVNGKLMGLRDEQTSRR